MARLPNTVPAFTKVKDSSNVHAISYEPSTRYLYVQFHPATPGDRPTTYRYANVQEKLFHQFLSAPSKGMFVWAHLRDKYAYAKWTGFGWRKSPALQRMSATKSRRKKLFKSWTQKKKRR